MADEPKQPPKPAAAPPKPVQIGGESFLDRYLPHIKKIAWTCVGIGVVAAIFFGVRAWKQRGERKSTTALADVIAITEEPIRGPDEKPDPKKPSFANATERATAVLAAIANGNAKVSPTFEGPYLIAAGRFDDAIAKYHTCETATAVDGVLCREGLGLALEAKAIANKDAAAQKKGYEEALAAFKTMQPEPDGPRADYAKYHEARMLELLEKRDDAKAAFLKAKDLAKDTKELTELISARLANLGA